MKKNKLISVVPFFILAVFVGRQIFMMSQKEATINDFIIETIASPVISETQEDLKAMSRVWRGYTNIIGHWREYSDGSWFEFVFNSDLSFNYRIVLNRMSKDYNVKGQWMLVDGVIYLSNLEGDRSMLTSNKTITILGSREGELNLYAPPIGYFKLKKKQ